MTRPLLPDPRLRFRVVTSGPSGDEHSFRCDLCDGRWRDQERFWHGHGGRAYPLPPHRRVREVCSACGRAWTVCGRCADLVATAHDTDVVHHLADRLNADPGFRLVLGLYCEHTARRCVRPPSDPDERTPA